MIAITSENGRLIKVIPATGERKVVFHPLFGFVTEQAFQERVSRRKRNEYIVKNLESEFEFSLKLASGADFTVNSIKNCSAKKEKSQWQLETQKGRFILKAIDEVAPQQLAPKEEEKSKKLITSIIMALLLPVAIFLFPKSEKSEEPQVIETVIVKVKPETVKPVAVIPGIDALPKDFKQAQQMKRAIQQDLGFLGLLGRKDLNKALGGAPTQLKDASAGAGPGGKEGSGGEYLVGLGQGLKRATVGNTGVAGLGGIGTKGAGGGLGGYGNSMIGSGEGKGLSTIPLSQDVILEGGLDRSVVQATIAKYLSQVRACYEQGLKRNAGLGGLVTMGFEVNGGGGINFAKVERSTLGDREVEECISVRMRDWKFPQPRGGVNVKVTYPFLLRSAKS